MPKQRSASANNVTGGRPLKDDGQDTKKKARLRRAQHAFRIRKQAAQEAQNRRLQSLEGIVEQMSAISLELCDSVLNSPLIQKDLRVIGKFHKYMEDFTSLARQVDLEDRQAMEEKSPEAQTTDGEDESANQTSDSISIPIISSLIQSSPPKPLSGATESLLTPSHSFDPLATLTTDHLMIANPFGNGWTDQLPAPFTHSVEYPPMETLKPLGIGIMLLQHTLKFAYTALSGDLPNEFAQRIFKFALLLHDKEELLFNLRWFLGPGFPEIRRLAHGAYQDAAFPTLWTREHSNSATKIHRPRLESSISNTTEGDTQFLNVQEVEELLRGKGLRQIDHDTMEITLPAISPATTRDILLDHNLQQISDIGDFAAGNIDTRAGDTFHFTSTSRTTSETSPYAMHFSTSFAQKKQTYLLRATSLFENLAKVSVCLEQGPGFRIGQIENAIALSVIA